MVNNHSDLFNLIKNTFISECNISIEEAESSAQAILVSYVWGAGQPADNIPLDHLRKLERIFINEINNGTLKTGAKHAEVVKTLSTKIMESARI